MKQKAAVTIAIVLMILASCTRENISKGELSYEYVSITGAAMDVFSRTGSRAESVTNLEVNDAIIFSSQGGIIANRDTLIYDGDKWNGLKSEKWEVDNRMVADYCALYPMLKEYDAANLYYENNELKDVVCCKSTTEYGGAINLSFKHLFAKVQINIDNELNKALSKINITVPNIVDKIDINTGEVATNGVPKEITLQPNETGRYEIFVPANSNQTIPFKLTLIDGTMYDAVVGQTEYQSGYLYVCNVKYTNGIYSTEDFIAFSHLIKGKGYKERKLEEFYIEKDGRRVFNLFADIKFTKEETKLLGEIDPYNKAPFNDIFDGNNHIISGLYYDSDVDRRQRVALFGYTSENSIIRNITFDDVSMVENTKNFWDTAALLVGDNDGLIDNCNIKNVTIISRGEKEISGLCSNNHGYIINSYVEGFAISKKNGNSSYKFTPLCTNNHGNILNCGICIDIDCKANDYIYTICKLNVGNIENIFTYGYIANSFVIWTLEFGSSSTNILFNKKFETGKQIFHDQPPYGSNDEPDGKPNGKLEYITHNDTPEDYIKNAVELNEWIDQVGKSKYSQFKFKYWQSDGTSAPKMYYREETEE